MQPFGKTVWQFLTKLIVNVPNNSAILFLVFKPKRNGSMSTQSLVPKKKKKKK